MNTEAYLKTRYIYIEIIFDTVCVRACVLACKQRSVLVSAHRRLLTLSPFNRGLTMQEVTQPKLHFVRSTLRHCSETTNGTEAGQIRASPKTKFSYNTRYQTKFPFYILRTFGFRNVVSLWVEVGWLHYKARSQLMWFEMH